MLQPQTSFADTANVKSTLLLLFSTFEMTTVRDHAADTLSNTSCQLAQLLLDDHGMSCMAWLDSLGPASQFQYELSSLIASSP